MKKGIKYKNDPTSPNYYTRAFDTYWNMMEPTEKQNKNQMYLL